MNQQSHTKSSLLSLCLEKNLNFAIFSYPGSNEVELIIENPTLKTHHLAGFVLRPFELSEKHPEVFISADFHLKSEADFANSVEAISSIPSTTKEAKEHEVHVASKANYLEDLNNAIASLSRLKVDKFIYSRIKRTDITEVLDLAKLFFQVNKNHENAYVSLVNHSDSGLWMGATPETLINWTGGTVSTMSLAGTQPISEETPVWGEKEKEEQKYVTQYIEDCFSKNRIPFEKEDTISVKAGSVFHLQNIITSQTRVSFIQALHLTQSLHPTPAICGVPLPRAKKMIREIEKHERAYYTGYVGFIDPNKEVKLFVNLRCMQIFSNYVALYLGGGITSKSVAEKEWNETIFKSKTLLNEIEAFIAK